MTGCSRACRARRRGIPPPRAAGSAAASRTRTRGSRAAGRPAAPRRPRRNAAACRRSRRSPHEGRRARVPAPAHSRRWCGSQWWSCRLPGVVSGTTLTISTAASPQGDTLVVHWWFHWRAPTRRRSQAHSGRPRKVCQSSAQLPARADAKLAEHLAQVPFDGAGAEEQLGGNLRIAKPVTSELGDLHFLCGELIARLDRALAHGLARSQQLATAAFSERLQAHRGEPLVGGAQLLAC